MEEAPINRRAKRLGLAFGALFAIVLAAPAGAHPLGNFTTNVHLGVEIGESAIDLVLIVDMAEIPTFREIPEIDKSGDRTISADEAATYAAKACDDHQSSIGLTLESSRMPLAATRGNLQILPGEGGLDILRLECGYRSEVAIAPEGNLQVDNGVFADRLGWREMTVTAQGVRVQTDLPSTSPSALLTSFPSDSPLSISSAVIDVTPDPGAIRTDTVEPLEPAGLIGTLGSNLTAQGAGLWALVAAVGLGIGHALAPGHGKTLMAAYLVGRGGTWRQASVLGLSVAISHTVGVGVLGVITVVAAESFQPDRVYPWLSGLSALTVTTIGAVMLYRALARRRHDHHHQHEHEHSHNDQGPGTPAKLGWKSLAALGLAGGLVPSASAVVLLLGAVSRGDPWFGLGLVAAFGLGMSAALVGAGLIAVGAVRWGWRFVTSGRIRHRLEHVLPGLAAIAVTGVGITLLWQVALSWS